MSDYYQPCLSLKKTGENFRKIRKELGLSVKTVAKQIGLSGVQSIYDWETARCLPDLQNLLAISRVYNTTIDSILVCEDEDAASFNIYYEIVLMTFIMRCDII
ncbi:MAG: helix-turn-helix transcriptional regulator [Ruminococcus sp.]|nr:helix-turn-helix transcriptional regulator [Ruminococcus sp.]